jgi:hypothetical protein
MTDLRDEFLSEEDLDLRNLSQDELIAYWNLWLEQAQATNDLDEALYSHGVFERDPAERLAARPPVEKVLERIRERKATGGTGLSSEEILARRDVDRR